MVSGGFHLEGMLSRSITTVLKCENKVRRLHPSLPSACKGEARRRHRCASLVGRFLVVTVGPVKPRTEGPPLSYTQSTEATAANTQLDSTAEHAVRPVKRATQQLLTRGNARRKRRRGSREPRRCRCRCRCERSAGRKGGALPRTVSTTNIAVCGCVTVKTTRDPSPGGVNFVMLRRAHSSCEGSGPTSPTALLSPFSLSYRNRHRDNR